MILTNISWQVGEIGRVYLPENTVKEELQLIPCPGIPVDSGTKWFEMGRLRKLIAYIWWDQKDGASCNLIFEADITAMVEWRDKHKDEFYRKEQAKLTYTHRHWGSCQGTQGIPAIIFPFPGFIIMRKNINIGFAMLAWR